MRRRYNDEEKEPQRQSGANDGKISTRFACISGPLPGQKPKGHGEFCFAEHRVELVAFGLAVPRVAHQPSRTSEDDKTSKEEGHEV